MVKSPFPGMDPYLEQDLLDVHTRLVSLICDQIQDQLPRDLCARMESRVLLEDYTDEEQAHRHPDVRVVEAGPTASAAVLERPAVSTIEPDLRIIGLRSEPAAQRYIEIIDAQTGRRVVTTIELLSPSNKLAGADQRLFLAKREDCLTAGVNFVEIDLTRKGERLPLWPWLAQVESLPTYLACVHRALPPGETAFYFFPLDKPLKPMRIPLRATDEDVVLSLQPLVETAYLRGRYDSLNYRDSLDPPLTGKDAEIAEQLLATRRRGATS